MPDLIDRQAAIDAIHNADTQIYEGEAAVGRRNYMTKEECCEIIDSLPSAQSEIVMCKDCKHFHYDMPYVIQGIPVLGHEVCDFWGDGCKTSENGFCSYAERITNG